MVEFISYGGIAPAFQREIICHNNQINEKIDEFINNLICEYLGFDFVHNDYIKDRFSLIYNGNNEILILDNKSDCRNIISIKNTIDFGNNKIETQIKALFKDEKNY